MTLLSPFSKSLPVLVHVDDILFRKPVEIGSLLYFSSQVVYTQGQFVMVRVSAEVVQAETGSHDLTNVFHFTLKTAKVAPEVIPRSYQGALPFFSLLFSKLANSYLSSQSFCLIAEVISCLFYTFTEAMLYLDGRRHFLDTQTAHNSESTTMTTTATPKL